MMLWGRAPGGLGRKHREPCRSGSPRSLPAPGVGCKDTEEVPEAHGVALPPRLSPSTDTHTPK